jgi:ESCRT-I complex subunit TSG101
MPGAMPGAMPQAMAPYPVQPTHPTQPSTSGYTPTPPYPTQPSPLPTTHSTSSHKPPPPYPTQQTPLSTPSTVSHTPTPPYPTSSQSSISTVTPAVVGVVAAKNQTSLSNQTSLDRQQSVDDKVKLMSVQTAVEDKLKRQMKEIFERAQSEMQSLEQTKNDLQTGSRKLNEMLNTLDKKEREVEESINQLTEKDEEIRQALEKLDRMSDELTVDETVVATNPLHKQILNLFAEENAIEDTIYYLTEGLRKGVINVEIFLKQVRALSRQQFMLRALMQKARQTAGLQQL